MKKVYILGIVTGLLLSLVTTYAVYKYQATEVGYSPSNSNFDVDNVNDAIKELYTKVTTGPTYVAPQTGQTHKGIVYLDPTNLKKGCDASNSVSTTEKKTGCMKWYVFKDDTTNNEYTMILDHNTTARIKWNDENKNVAVGSSNIADELTALSNSSGWKVIPRLITAYEVNDIVGGVSTWSVSSTGTWFYFEGTGTKNQTMPDYSTTRSKYHWLYDNLSGCHNYGCEIEDTKSDYIGTGTAGNGPSYHYWTSTPVGNTGSGVYMWIVEFNGSIHGNDANLGYHGVRPVITISKSIIKS